MTNPFHADQGGKPGEQSVTKLSHHKVINVSVSISTLSVFVIQGKLLVWLYHAISSSTFMSLHQSL